jgi:hypothetical protein
MTFTQRLFTIGCFLFFWYACLAIIPQVSLLLGFKLAVWQVAASFALFLVASWAFQFKFLEQKSFVSFGLNLAFATAIFYFGLIYSNQFFDISFDGNYYHLDAIYLLKKGWNPVYHVLIEEETSYSDKYPQPLSQKFMGGFYGNLHFNRQCRDGQICKFHVAYFKLF